MRRLASSLLATAAILTMAPLAASAGEIAGRVSAGDGVVSLAGVQVEIVELGRTVATGTDGSFRFPAVPAGTYTLRTTYAAGAPVERRVQVPAEGTTTADLSLQPAEGQAIEEIVVVGQRFNLASAVSRQRAADGVQSVLTRDSIGQFPDQNVAESIRRLPGVNVLNDQGEGRFISVRGLDPALNAASINGVRTPAPEADTRAVALDVIPAELIESIEVKKTLTPDMDADTLGASIEINTTSALERREPFLGLKLEGSYNDLTDTWSPKGSLDFSTRLTDRLAVAGGLSYYKRRFATDNVEADNWNVENGVVYAVDLEYRDYDVARERLGGSLSVDYLLNDSTDLFFRLLHSRFEDQEFRRRLIFDMEDATPRAGTGSTASFDSADGERFTVIRDEKDRFESQTITSVSVGGETRVDAWTFDYMVAYAEAKELEDGSLDPARWRQRFSGAAASGGAVTFDYSQLGKPGFSFTRNGANFLNPARYSFFRLEETDLSESRDREYTGQADITRTVPLAAGSLDVQVGAKARLREKTYDFQMNFFDGYTGGLPLTGFVGPATFGITDINPVPGKRAFRDFFGPNRSRFQLSAVDTAYESAIADYAVDEDVYAGYALGRFETATLRLIGGVRVEHTENTLAGNRVELVEEGATRNGVVLGDDTVFVTRERFSRSYTDWMPSVLVRLEAAEDIVLRLGAYRNLVRPGIGQVAPRFIVEESEDGERSGEFGNPSLKPYRAWNLDAGGEWYFAREAVVSAGVFYKTVEDFIVNAEFENGTFNGVRYDEAVIPINGDEAEIFGVELNYQQSLIFLPEPFDGLLVSFNYTYTDAEGDVLGRTIPLPASSKHNYTAVLGYEKGPISLRLAASYRDEYLDEVRGSAQEDRYVKDHLQWDASAKYQINDHIQVFAELINIGDEPYLAFQKGPNGDRLLQYEEYSWTAKLGTRITF